MGHDAPLCSMHQGLVMHSQEKNFGRWLPRPMPHIQAYLSLMAHAGKWGRYFHIYLDQEKLNIKWILLVFKDLISHILYLIIA